MSKKYTKEFLISELHRFVKENGRIPTKLNMQKKFRYPSMSAYYTHFGSWNNALKEAGLELNQYHNCWQDGTEVCSECGKLNNKNAAWTYIKNKRLCTVCKNRNESLYKQGELSIQSTSGFAFSSQRLVMQVLQLSDEYDCNITNGFSSSFDIYDKNKYGKIDVKVATLQMDNRWRFNFYNKEEPDTYILIGFNSSRNIIMYVWVILAKDILIKNKSAITIKFGSNTPSLLKMHNHSVDVDIYNKIWKNMSLKFCKYLKR